MICWWLQCLVLLPMSVVMLHCQAVQLLGTYIFVSPLANSICEPFSLFSSFLSFLQCFSFDDFNRFSKLRILEVKNFYWGTAVNLFFRNEPKFMWSKSSHFLLLLKRRSSTKPSVVFIKVPVAIVDVVVVQLSCPEQRWNWSQWLWCHWCQWLLWCQWFWCQWFWCQWFWWQLCHWCQWFWWCHWYQWFWRWERPGEALWSRFPHKSNSGTLALLVVASLNTRAHLGS